MTAGAEPKLKTQFDCLASENGVRILTEQICPVKYSAPSFPPLNYVKN